MTQPTVSAFHLPADRAAKAEPALIAADDEHFAAIEAAIEDAVATASSRLEQLLRTRSTAGAAAVERDLEIHRLNAQLNTLRRYGIDLCLGRMVFADRPDEPVYIGRVGLAAPDGRRLLVDWRTPAAEPFFGATHGDPMGLASRRRYRWTDGRVSDYWDEVFAPDGVDHQAALDDQSAFIASLGATRTSRMRDVLATIQADQDAIIRAGSQGTLVVDGGPGTGKTVVALHRAAYLMYADTRIAHGSGGGVLVVGPHQPYLAYVDDVLPSLGEDAVRTCTLRDLVPGGADLPDEADARVAQLKADARLVDAVAAAVRLYERPPAEPVVVETPMADVELTPEEWEAAFDAAAGEAHNDARDEVWDVLVEILGSKLPGVPASHVRRVAEESDARTVFDRTWPVLDPLGLVAAMWSNPGFLRRCAPWLDDEELQALQRADARAWTASDLPFLDAARRLVGDPDAARIRRERERIIAAERQYRGEIADYLREFSDDDLGLMSMLRGEDAQNSLDDEDALPRVASDPLAGPFAHIIVDEAQELTDAQWRMLVSRCPSRSFTVVGDRAQARHGFTESWEERLRRIGLGDVRLASLTINYRTPAEVMAEAEPVIRAAIPDANVPTSVRSSGIPVRHGDRAELDGIVRSWLETNDEGVACVIGDAGYRPPSDRVRSLTPELAKGLEFDLVVVVDAAAFGSGIEGAVDRYVAMTRSTRELVLLGDAAAR